MIGEKLLCIVVGSESGAVCVCGGGGAWWPSVVTPVRLLIQTSYKQC